MTDARLTRRALLASALSLCGAAAFLGREAPGERALANAAVRLVRDGAEVGRLYLEGRRAEADAVLLADLVKESLDREAGGLRVRLAAAVRADFREGRVVSIDGWRLSRTEARICALAHLAARVA